jgi:hypothetical protein
MDVTIDFLDKHTIDTAPPDGTVVMVLLNYEKNSGKGHARGMD